MLLGFFTAEDAKVVGEFFVMIGVIITGYVTIKTRLAVGKPNGKGDVVEMNEKQIKQNEELLAQHGKILQRMGTLEDKSDFISDMLLKHISTPGAHGGITRDPYADWDPAARR